MTFNECGDDGQHELIECINGYHLSLGQLAFELSHLRSRAGFQIRRIVNDFETASRIFSFSGRGFCRVILSDISSSIP